MSVNVSGCYYHPDKGAVATCAQCGRGVCSSCAVQDNKTGRIICYRCANTKINQKQKEHRKLLKETGGRFSEGRDFIRPIIRGIIWVIIVLIAVGLLDYFVAKGELFYDVNWDIGTITVGVMIWGWMLFWIFGIPFGMIWWNDVFPKKYTNTEWANVRSVLGIIFSIFFGWILFTFYLIRFIVIKIRKK